MDLVPVGWVVFVWRGSEHRWDVGKTGRGFLSWEDFFLAARGVVVALFIFRIRGIFPCSPFLAPWFIGSGFLYSLCPPRAATRMAEAAGSAPLEVGIPCHGIPGWKWKLWAHPAQIQAALGAPNLNIFEEKVLCHLKVLSLLYHLEPGQTRSCWAIPEKGKRG